MKCIKRDNPETKQLEIKRVADNIASKLISSGWSFCSKKEWKEKVRDVTNTTVSKVVEERADLPQPVTEEVHKKKVSGRQRQKKLGEN